MRNNATTLGVSFVARGKHGRPVEIVHDVNGRPCTDAQHSPVIPFHAILMLNRR